MKSTYMATVVFENKEIKIPCREWIINSQGRTYTLYSDDAMENIIGVVPVDRTVIEDVV
jgi:hypothetical protein